MEQQMLEKMIREAILSMSGESESCGVNTGTISVKDYPLSKNKADILKSSTGKSLKDFTVENVMNGSIKPEDIRISPETLEMQAQVAESDGRKAFAQNLRRAAELIAVPDDRILEIYDKLRPYRSTKDELLGIASELETKYNAKINAALVREATVLYEKRDRLKR
nr:diol dehydratase small subunit [uncultured Ilyobacter sp.]